MASEVVGVLGIEVDLTELNKLNRALGRTEKSLKDTEKEVKDLEKTLKRISAFGQQVFNGIGIGIVAVTGAATAAAAGFTAISGELDAVAKAGARLGIATNELVGLQFAAEQSGSSAETLTQGIQELQKRLGEAVNGMGEANKWLVQFSINANELATMNPSQQLEILARAIQKVGSRAERVKLADALFGGSGIELLNLLEAGEKGLRDLRIEGEQLSRIKGVDLQGIQNANDAVNRMQTGLRGVSNVFSSKLAPVVEEFSDKIAEALLNTTSIEKSATVFAETVRSSLEGLSTAIIFVRENFQILVGVLAAGAAYKALSLLRGVLVGIGVVVVNVIKQMNNLSKSMMLLSLVNPGLTAILATIKGIGVALAVIVRANPVGAIITLISVAVGAFVAFKDSIFDAKEEQKKLNDIIDKGTQKYKDLQDEIGQMGFNQLRVEIESINNQLKQNALRLAESQRELEHLQGEWFKDAEIEEIEDEIIRLKEQNELLIETVQRLTSRYVDLHNEQKEGSEQNSALAKALDEQLAKLNELTETRSLLNSLEFEGRQLLENEKEIVDVINAGRNAGINYADGLNELEQQILLTISQQKNTQNLLNADINRTLYLEKERLRIAKELEEKKEKEKQNLETIIQSTQVNLPEEKTLENLQRQQEEEMLMLQEHYEAKRQLALLEAGDARSAASAVTDLTKEENEKRTALEKKQTKDKQDFESEVLRKNLSSTEEFFGNMASLSESGNKTLGAIGKASAISQATIAGILAVQRAMAAPPGPPWSYAIAASAGVMAAMNVSKIMATPLANGGLITSPSIVGTTVGGSPALAGERGVEAVMPLRRNARGQLGVIGTGVSSQGVSVGAINVNVGRTDNPEEAGLAAEEGVLRAMQQVAKNEIGNQQRSGGQLNPLTVQNVFG